MSTTAGELTQETRRLAAALKTLEQRLRMEPEPEIEALNEFREAMDNVRLTTWSVSELLVAHRNGVDRKAVLKFVAAERLRRLKQLIANLGSDIEQGLITAESPEWQALEEMTGTIQQWLAQTGNSSTSAHRG